MHHLQVAAAVLALLWAWPGAASAQVATTGSIQVIIEDSGGGRLPGVTVTAKAVDAITTRTAVTNSEGVAVLEALAPSAAYEISATLSGFQGQTVTNVLIRSGQTATARFTLQIAGLTEQVTVRGEAPLVDTTKATTGQDITLRADRVAADRPQLPELPAAGARRPARRPGAVGQPGGAVGPELQRHRRRRRRLDRQRLLLRRHQRHRPGDRHLRRQPEHRDHPGAEGRSPAASRPSSSARRA